MDCTLLFVLSLCKSLRRYSNASTSEIQISDNFTLWSLWKAIFVCCAILDGVYALLCNYQKGINENGEKKFCVIFSWHCWKKIYSPLFQKSAGFYQLCKMMNECLPCSLLLLKSFLFMPVIQGLCFDCSWAMKTLSCWWINTATF